MYCPRCKMIVDADKCPDCHKPTRKPEMDDVCLLIEKPLPIAAMVKDVLEQNGIPSMQMGVLGAGLSTLLGSNIEYARIYTTYSDHQNALELTDELFGAPLVFDEENPDEIAEDQTQEDEPTQ